MSRRTPKRKEEIRRHRSESIDEIIFAVAMLGMMFTVLYLVYSAFR